MAGEALGEKLGARLAARLAGGETVGIAVVGVAGGALGTVDGAAPVQAAATSAIATSHVGSRRIQVRSNRAAMIPSMHVRVAPGQPTHWDAPRCRSGTFAGR